MIEWIEKIVENIFPTLLCYIKPIIITFISTTTVGNIAEGYVLDKKYSHDLKQIKAVAERPLVTIFTLQDSQNKDELYFEPKDFKPETISIPSDFKENVVKKQMSEVIKEFTDTVERKIPNINLYFMYENLRSLKVSRMDNLYMIFFKGWSGIYSTSNNEIKLSNKSKLTFFHELFHMASSFKRDGVDYCGFAQYNVQNGSIGSGINEGYTELLIEHYFGKNSSGYKVEKEITRKIENIIGHDKMTQLYFNADLQGLINELSQYCSLDDALRLIQTADYINYITLNHAIGSPLVRKIYLDKSISLVNNIIDSITDLKNKIEPNQKMS